MSTLFQITTASFMSCPLAAWKLKVCLGKQQLTTVISTVPESFRDRGFNLKSLLLSSISTLTF